MKVKIRRWLGPALVPVLAATFFFAPTATSTGAQREGNLVLQRALDRELGRVKPAKWEMPVSSGVVYTLLEASGVLAQRAEGAPTGPGPSNDNTQGCSLVRDFVNIRVNQDCSLRRQAEETLAINPVRPQNMIAGQNDSRIGYNHCGYDWTFDGGLTWGDQVPPFWQILLADGHTADACSDPTATFDSQGNAYVGGIFFDVVGTANAILVAKSNFPIGGAYYHTPVPGAFQEYTTSTMGVVASDAGPEIFNDKELMVADDSPGSPKADNVYMTWTRFNADTGQGVGANSPIYFSQSTDGGATWSPGVEISGRNPQVCTDFSGDDDPAVCDQDQGSHPIVGPDGTVYVAFGNGNTPDVGVNQILFVKCPASKDCSNSASWTQPVKVNDLIDNHPTGPSDEGCPPGRQCLPPNGYRVPEFTSISISVDQANRLYLAWADFRNGGPPCVGDANTAQPPCDNDAFYTFSTNGGASWAPERNIAPASLVGENAQWQPWSDVVKSGKKLYVAFYDRQYGDCEFTGCNDITLASITSPRSNSPTVTLDRITTGSMPNLTPANNPVQAGFLGDYMWVVADGAGDAHVVWADTRGRGGTVEEDIYYYTSGSR